MSFPRNREAAQPKKRPPDIPLEEFKQHVSYDPSTGVFTRLMRTTFSRCKVGAKAGTLNGWGYIDVGVFGRKFRAHRLAWFYMTGAWPAKQIDHINGDRSDNRFTNLRLATPTENRANARNRVNSKSGLKGAFLVRGKWRSQIKKDGVTRSLGVFATAEEAHAAYVAAAKDAFGEFARAA